MSLIRETRADRIFNFVNLSLLSIILIVVLYPLIFVVSASISDPDLINLGKVWLLPKGVNFDGYRRVFQDGDIWNGYRNTILYTLLGTAVNLLVTIPAAYALSRKDFLGRNVLMAIFTFTMFFHGGLIPNYLLIKSLGLRDNIWVMVLPSAVGM